MASEACGFKNSARSKFVFRKHGFGFTFCSSELLLAEFIEEQSNKNTLSKTNRDVSLLKEFLRAKEVDKEIEDLEAKELDAVLCAFIVEVKKKDGGEYEPTTLRSFISSCDRYLRKKGYPTTIIDGQEFRKTRETLVAKQKELKKAGKGKKSKAARALTDDEVEVKQTRHWPSTSVTIEGLNSALT